MALVPRAVERRGMAPPPEVLDYFREKRLAPKFSWLDVWGQEHAHAFTVAGVTETRVLAEFKAAIDKAIVEGVGFDKFRAEMERRLTPLGWWGRRDVVDPEGRAPVKRVDFSKARRLEVTFWSNVRAARAAGQWDRIQRTKRVLPYLLYVRSTAERKRPEHLGWAGIILPADHGWWTTHFPPNGWRCKCGVRQISGAEREQYLDRDVDPGEENAIAYRDEVPADVTRTFRNRRTGEVTQVPEGIDPGWHTNPGIGRGRQLGRILADAIDETPIEFARGRIRWLTESEGFQSFLWNAQRVGAEREVLRKARRAIADIDKEAPWSHAPTPVARLTDKLARDLGVERATVTVTDAAVAHAPAHHYPDWIWARLQEMIDAGTVHRRVRDGRVLVVHEIDGRTFVAILARMPGDRLGVITLFRTERGERGREYLRKELLETDRLR